MQQNFSSVGHFGQKLRPTHKFTKKGDGKSGRGLFMIISYSFLQLFCLKNILVLNCSLRD